MPTGFQHRQVRAWLFALLLVIGLLVASNPTVQAGTITVTNTADRGNGSLRQAIASAKNNDTIIFAANLSGATISLNSGSILLDKSITIDASSLPVAVTLSGNNANAHFVVSAGVSVTLVNMTLVDGNGSFGGAIYNQGILTVDRVTFHNNSALQGGAIYNVGPLTVLNSTFHGNTSFNGGAISNLDLATIKNSTLVNNSSHNPGGGIANAEKLWLYNTIIADSPNGGDCVNEDNPQLGLLGTLEANVNNLIEDGSCEATLSGDPGLDALAAVDGALVHRPMAGSAAIDNGDNTTCETTDQRNLARPQGTACDIGSVEVVTAVTPIGGDCNGDQQVDAGDLTAIALEIFDGDGSARADVSGGTFAGTAGCDANDDTKIDAGDISCSVRFIFDGAGTCADGA